MSIHRDPVQQNRVHQDIVTRPHDVSLKDLDLDTVNGQLAAAKPAEIIRWALELSVPTIATTSFGKNAAAMLHALVGVEPSVPVIWVDTGYNLRDTYIVAEKLIKRLALNIHVYSPAMTSERRNAIMGGIPTIEDQALHEDFTRQVKLDPFDRALAEFSPQLWLTGIRREETEHRQGLDIVSWDGRGILKVAPFFEWSSEQLEAYMAEHELPSCRHYFDPTKVQEGRECGMHTSA